MIRDGRILREEHVPIEVPHRNAEKNELSRSFRPIERGEPGEKATFVFGPSGTGKTCLSRVVLRQLEDEVPETQTKYINCWNNYSRFRTLYEVLDGFSSTVDIHRRSTPTDELLHRVSEYSGPPYVVVLDEVDQLEDKEVLYDLYTVPNISIVLIANKEEELFAQLEDRLTSRLHGSRRIYLERYHIDELVDILEDRVRYALEGEAISRGQLETIADAAAGDARRGLAILRNAAHEATHQGLDEISDEVIETVLPVALEELRQKTVDMLRDHQRALYEIIEQDAGISPNELYRRYEERVDDPRTDRTVRNYLRKMQHYGLIEAHGSSTRSSYRR
jgi:Cdc6-like AAA superfamily ATPase